MPAPRPQRLRFLARVLLLGLLSTILSSLLLWWICDPTSASNTSTGYTQAAATLDRQVWLVDRWSRVGCQLTRSVVAPTPREPWSPEQATGAPDTPRMHDLDTAWASATSDSQVEWLILTFDPPVPALRVRIIESNAPGAIVRVAVKGPSAPADRDTGWTTIHTATVTPAPNSTPDSFSPTITPTPSLLPSLTSAVSGASGAAAAPPADPNAPPPPLLPIAVEFAIPPDPRAGTAAAPLLITSVRIDLDSPNVRGWNEIDAVALVTGDATPHWATEAIASSTYANRSRTAPASLAPESVLASWISLPTAPTPTDPAHLAPHDHLYASYGFPWPALAGSCDLSTVTRPGNSFDIATIVPLARADTTPAIIPWRPLPLGLLLNTLVHAAVFAALAAIVAAPFRISRELRRMRKGHCVRCGYDLRFDFAKGCPECGFLRAQP